MPTPTTGTSSCGRPERPGSADSFPLPVLASEPRPAPLGFGRSRNGVRRAVVLVLVHVVFGLHLLHWYTRGETLSPVEPSEAMYTLETGAINAGALFFGAALLATLVFGRFFCGWGCHVVALQDLCAWLLSRVGIRPRPFRSRLLVFVPLFFACYMFVWPTFKREALLPLLHRWLSQDSFASAERLLGRRQAFPGWSVELMVPDFWATFAGPIMAVPFLLVCGFGCVYFLGAKGFCTYGCPYGGFFYYVDKVSPGRIVVDHDKCEGCGHCTATCTSNVRVHEEIRDFGMVVDAGCMKCLDCVAICPNDALAFKIDRPGLFKTARRGRATSRPDTPKPAAARPAYDASWAGEIALVLVFAGVFVTFRGLYGAVPMLMAIGVAACCTFVFWRLARLVTDRNATLHNFRLKLAGRWRAPGVAFALVALVVLAFTAHSAAVRLIQRGAGSVDDRVTVPASAVFTMQRPPLAPEQEAAAREAIRRYTLASSWRDGGIALASTPAADVRLAWLHSVVGDFAKAEGALRRIMARGQLKENLASNLAQIIALQQRPADAEAVIREALERHPRFDALRADLANRLMQGGRVSEAESLYRDAVKRSPRSARSHFQLGVILLAQNRASEAIEPLRTAVELDPKSPGALQQLGGALLGAGKIDEGVAALKRAVELSPEDPLPAMALARTLLELGRKDEARTYIDLAEKIQKARSARPTPTNPPSHP